MKRLLILFITSFLLLQVDATTYYVKVAGGTGTGLDDANAWSYSYLYGKTLSAGDIVLFKRGDVFVGQHYAKDGVTYDAYGTGASPIISGFTTLASWTLSSGNIYYATLDVPKLNGVTVDGLVVGMGRYPKTGYLTYTTHSANTSITGTTIGTLPFSFVGAEVVMKKYRWILDRHTITAQSGNTITYSTSTSYGNNSVYNPYDGQGYFIQNSINCLTQDGDWWYDVTNKRLYVYFSSTPSGRVVKASNISQVVPLNSSNGITFNNIDFEGGDNAIVCNSANNITINNCNFRQQGANGIYAITARNINVTGGSISNALNNSIFAEYQVNKVTLTGITITNSGMVAGAGTSGDGSYGCLFINGDTTTVTGCSISNTGFNGIHFVGNKVLIQNNFVTNTNNVKDDGGGIYAVTTTNITQTNRVIDHNIITNIVGSPAGTEDQGNATGFAQGIYLDDYTNGTIVSNNFIQNAPTGILANGGHDNSITGNTTFDCANGLLFKVYNSRSVRNMTVTGNKFVAKTAGQYTLFVEQQYNESPSLWGTINNNYYARPISEGATIGWYQWNYSGASNVTTNYTVAGWNTASGFDAASLPSQVTTTVAGNIRADYNFSSSVLNVPLSALYKDVANNSYNGNIALQAYSGSVLVVAGTLASPTAPTLNGGVYLYRKVIVY
jgi:parallel beta-helix repeat protein